MELYGSPTSFYSKKVVLTLAVKNIKYTAHMLDLSKGESRTPEFLKMNPLGEVPVLKDGDVITSDSKNIVRYIDDKYGEPKLFPSKDTERGKLVEEYEINLNSINSFLLTFGSFVHPELVADSQVPEDLRSKLAAAVKSDDRVREMERAMGENPDMVDLYRAKCQDWKVKCALVMDKARVEEEIATTGFLLDQVEKQLAKSGGSKWMFGDDITIADITLAVTLFRFTKVGFAKRFWKDGKHPLMEKYQSKLANFDEMRLIDAPL